MFPFHFIQKKKGGGNPLYQYITSLNPIVYFPLNELSGVTAINYGTLGIVANGTYNGPTLNSIAAPGGTTAPLFDGINDYVNALTAALINNISFSEGTALIWFKVYSSADWYDGSNRTMFRYLIDYGSTDSEIHFRKSAANLYGVATFGGTAETYLVSGGGTTEWNLFTITWSKSNDRVRYYWNNVLKETDTGLGTPIGTLTSAFIGAQGVTGYLYHGYLAHAAVFDYELTAEQIAAIYTLGI